jgi:sterol desaturase/sphingolipid hydroxylase (fatty acid hydroxylase superfamily)
MSERSYLEFLAGAGIAIVVASLAEYWVHRLMHSGRVLGQKHLAHHRDGWGQGWLGEFWDYWSGGLLVIWAGFVYSLPAGIGYAAGVTLYAALAAYAHQLQHERPELCFWLPQPVHYLHHHYRMWRHNFGITLDLWDRVFGTYRPVAWKPERPFSTYPWRDFFRISWLAYTPPPTSAAGPGRSGHH